MDSPGGYPESLLDQDGDQDDVVYPCKGCGEVMAVIRVAMFLLTIAPDP
jgi:hypothetical protein